MGEVGYDLKFVSCKVADGWRRGRVFKFVLEDSYVFLENLMVVEFDKKGEPYSWEMDVEAPVEEPREGGWLCHAEI
jgi:hypothetical protein